MTGRYFVYDVEDNVDTSPDRAPRLLKSSFRILLLTVLGTPVAGWALDAGYRLGYGLEYTDNAFLTRDNKQDEWINSARAGFVLNHHSPSLDATVDSNAQYRNYKNNTYPDDTVFDLNLSGQWHIAPERFSWTLEDFYTQTVINPLTPSTPTNRQNTNIMSTGPNFIMRLNPVNTLEFGARYARNTYETSDIDNTRTSGSASLAHQWSPGTRVSLNLYAESVNYDTQAPGTNFNFTRRDAFAEFSNRGARDQFVLDGGSTRISRDNAADVTGGLGRLRWTHQISVASNIALYASSTLSDAGQQALSQGQSASLGTLQPSFSIPIVTGDVFREKSVEVVYVVNRDYGSNTFRVFRQKDEFEVSPADQDRRGGSFDIGHDFSGALTGAIFATYQRVEDFSTSPSLIYRDKTFGVRLVNRLRQRLALGIELRENRRDGDPLFANDYMEHRALLTLTYSDIRRVATRP